MTEQHKSPADSDDLDEFFGGVHIDDIPQGSGEDIQEIIAKMKANTAEQEGDTWENLEKNHGFKINVQIRAMDTSSTGHIVSAEEAERLIVTRGSMSKIPILALAADFEYAPLPKGYFRLLTVRGLGDFPMVEMETCPMDGAPEYAAMSYAWGREVSSRAFFCNGHNFAVPSHVLDALNHLGLAWMDKKIWIDAICINQENDAEKAVQVAEMRRIYHQAEQVIVWLGAEEDDSDFVLDNVETLVEWGLKARHYGFTPDQEEYQLLNPPPDTLCLNLGRFLERPWFHRVWVVQEMVLAKEAVLVCGNRFAEWNTFCTAVLLMEENGLSYLLAPMAAPFYGVPSPLVSVALANINELQRLRDKGREGLSAVDFIKLLKMGRFRKVTEPVDRVWGFLGLADEELRVAAAAFINYSPERRNEYYKTYADIGKLLLQRDPELTFLSTVPSANRPPEMPSWVANFHAAGLNSTSIQTQNNFAFHSGYTQSEGGKPVVEFGPDPYTLRLRGFRLDKVDKIITINFMPPYSWEEERIRRATGENFASWDRQCLALARATIPQGPAAVLDAHWRTLSFDQMARQPRLVVRETYLNWRNLVNKNYALYPGNLTVEAKKNVRSFVNVMGKSCSRAYFSTAGGRVGLGPRNAAPGDWVCVVYGAKVPYILRSRPPSSSMEFIGDSYVDGVMYGESLKEGMHTEVFSID